MSTRFMCRMDDAVVCRGILEASAFFLQKSFTPNVLSCKIRESLDRKREPQTEPNWGGRHVNCQD